MQARFAMLMLLPLMASTASGTDIYKCTGKNGSVSYVDTPCPNQQTTLLHKETKTEAAEAKQSRIANTIYRMLDNGQFDQARDFAAANGASALFQDRIQANVRRQAEERNREVAADAEQKKRQMQAEAEARHQQTMQEIQDKLVATDAADEKFRKEHWSEIKQQHLGEALQAQGSRTFNPARNQWCSVGQDGSTVCQATP